jgi:hypothetical protein
MSYTIFGCISFKTTVNGLKSTVLGISGNEFNVLVKTGHDLVPSNMETLVK